MITDRIINYILYGVVLVLVSWGGWNWYQKMRLQHTLDEYKVAQANLVAKAQEEYINVQNRNAAADERSRLAVQAAVRKVQEQHGPTIAAYNALAAAAAARVRDVSGTEGSPMSPATEDACGVERRAFEGRLAEIQRRTLAVIEAAQSVSGNFAACDAGIARYRAAIDWVEDPR